MAKRKPPSLKRKEAMDATGAEGHAEPILPDIAVEDGHKEDILSVTRNGRGRFEESSATCSSWRMGAAQGAFDAYSRFAAIQHNTTSKPVPSARRGEWAQGAFDAYSRVAAIQHNTTSKPVPPARRGEWAQGAGFDAYSHFAEPGGQ